MQMLIRNDAEFVEEKVIVRPYTMSDKTKATSALSVAALVSVLVIKRAA